MGHYLWKLVGPKNSQTQKSILYIYTNMGGFLSLRKWLKKAIMEILNNHHLFERQGLSSVYVIIDLSLVPLVFEKQVVATTYLPHHYYSYLAQTILNYDSCCQCWQGNSFYGCGRIRCVDLMCTSTFN